MPLLHRPTSHRARCLVLCPTRELATQIAEGFRAYGKHLGLRLAVEEVAGHAELPVGGVQEPDHDLSSLRSANRSTS